MKGKDSAVYLCVSCAIKVLSVVTLGRCMGFIALSLEVPPGRLLQGALPGGEGWLCGFGMFAELMGH